MLDPLSIFKEEEEHVGYSNGFSLNRQIFSIWRMTDEVPNTKYISNYHSLQSSHSLLPMFYF